MRSFAALDPQDAQLASLIGELSMRSDVFASLWSRHDVGSRYAGRKKFRHPQVGSLELDVEVIPLPADPGLTLLAHSAAVGSPSDDALRLLAAGARERRGEANTATQRLPGVAAGSAHELRRATAARPEQTGSVTATVIDEGGN